MTGTSEQASRPYRSHVREQRARETRRRVLAAAEATFVSSGWAGTTVRAVATRAGVSVPTVEALFGTKARLLKATIDVAIAGDDEPVPVLERHWTDVVAAASSAAELVERATVVLAAAQGRSAGLVLAVLEGSPADAELAELAQEMVVQRAGTAGWLVDALVRVAPLRAGLDREEAIDTVWLLIDPAVFDRLVRRLGWTPERYRRWIAGSVLRLLTESVPTSPPSQEVP